MRVPRAIAVQLAAQRAFPSGGAYESGDRLALDGAGGLVDMHRDGRLWGCAMG